MTCESQADDRETMTLFYDRSCPVCRAELDALDIESHGFELRDCSAGDFEDGEAAACGITQDAMMEAMHLRDADGNWYEGVDAFEIMYRRSGYPWLANLLARPALRPFLDRLYALIARNRHWIARLGLHHPMGVIVRWSQKRKRAAAASARPSASDS